MPEDAANVVADLGLSPAEAENLRVRSVMMRALIAHIRGNALTPRRAAKSLGVTASQVSELLTGHIESFTADDLIHMLASAGLRIDVRIRRVA